MRCITTFRSYSLAALLATIASVASFSGQAQAAAIPGLYNTGVDNANLPIALGSVDPHYKLIASDDPAYPAPPAADALVTETPRPFTWIGNSSTSQWISPNKWQAIPDRIDPPVVGNAQGTYIYELTFDLTSLDPKQAVIKGDWATDALGLIFLNGVYVTGTTNFNGPGVLTSFTIPAGSSYLPTINHLDFVVINGPAKTTGLRVENLGGDAPGIPEPSTVVLAGIGCLGLGLARFRRRGR